MSRARSRILIASVAVALLSVVSACGGSKQASTKSSTSPATTTAAPVTANPATAGSPTVTTGPVRATLHGANHTPVAGKNWAYTVRVTDAAGKSLAGTVETVFVVAGLGVVGRETPAVHNLKNGVLADVLQFPPDAVGHPITLATVVHTSAGAVALGWPVNVSK